MAGSQAHLRGIPVLFVRHGQSANNVLWESLMEKITKENVPRSEVERLWGEVHIDDPDLTKKGADEAVQLGNYIRGGLDWLGRTLRFYTSPFKRTLDTTDNITKAFSKEQYDVLVHPQIYETGGVYYINKQNLRDGPGKCFSRPDIERLYGYDASALPAEGPWYASGWESDSQSRERANGVSNWIKSAEFRELNENKIVVFVMHGNFIDHLQKAMMNIPEDATIDSKVTNDHTVHPVSFGTPNTATSLFFVFKDGRISVRYIGNVAHLNSCLETSYGRL
jgi:broad specificity phosphatase PhoE